MASYSYTKEFGGSFEEAEDSVRNALDNTGFGVLTRADIKGALKKALNIDFEDYVILGACRPPLAYEALKIEPEIGLLLPCNVIIYKKDEKVFVSAINPVVAMSVVDNPELEKVAREVKGMLEKAIDSI